MGKLMTGNRNRYMYVHKGTSCVSDNICIILTVVSGTDVRQWNVELLQVHDICTGSQTCSVTVDLRLYSVLLSKCTMSYRSSSARQLGVVIWYDFLRKMSCAELCCHMLSNDGCYGSTVVMVTGFRYHTQENLMNTSIHKSGHRLLCRLQLHRPDQGAQRWPLHAEFSF